MVRIDILTTLLALTQGSAALSLFPGLGLLGLKKAQPEYTHYPPVIAEYMDMHKHFMEQGAHNVKDYCKFDVTGRGSDNGDIQKLAALYTLEFGQTFDADRRAAQEIAYAGSNNNRKIMRKGFNHNMTLPVNGTDKFMYMALDNKWSSSKACIELCDPCIKAALNSKSHYARCHRASAGRRARFCDVGYGSNEQNPGLEETNLHWKC